MKILIILIICFLNINCDSHIFFIKCYEIDPNYKKIRILTDLKSNEKIYTIERKLRHKFKENWEKENWEKVLFIIEKEQVFIKEQKIIEKTEIKNEKFKLSDD